ncbi:MAG: 4-alpha-glucanotransferase [Candidatus Omnitrophica bacterium]|nr:4-alpha-glucanotransferase [Candidatus Omnitrophota bacterium]
MIIPNGLGKKRNRNNKRSSGVLLHISSLPSEYGIGDLGPRAYQFVDFLSESKQLYWQVLPLNPTEPFCGNSPYSSPSAFAANTLFISFDILLKDGYISKDDFPSAASLFSDKVHFEEVIASRQKVFDSAFRNFINKKIKLRDFEDFLKSNASWLDDYALFMTIKSEMEGAIWTSWPQGFRDREESSLLGFAEAHSEQILKEKFLQYLFYSQWDALKSYANSKNVKMIGDIPIYVSLDSVDVWKQNEIFQLDENKRPIFVAGVPPDYFSQTGQRWGNPVYNWEELKETNFEWWIERIRFNLKNFDIIRIDHFRGFVDYWAIPVQEETAVNGHWEQVPTDSFFSSLKKSLGDLPIIAEDLGMLSYEVKAKIESLGFPGMKILVFAFNGNLNENPYVPNNFGENAVVYTGTHDNNTVVGWFKEEAGNEAKINLLKFLDREVSIKNIHWEFIEMAMNSKANLSIIPLQDILGLGSLQRMNIPGTPSGNWEWRYPPNSLTSDIKAKLAELTINYNRF